MNFGRHCHSGGPVSLSVQSGMQAHTIARLCRIVTIYKEKCTMSLLLFVRTYFCIHLLNDFRSSFYLLFSSVVSSVRRMSRPRGVIAFFCKSLVVGLGSGRRIVVRQHFGQGSSRRNGIPFSWRLLQRGVLALVPANKEDS